MSTIDAVRGMRDVAPDEHALLQRVAAQLERAIGGYGYQQIDLPVVEQRDLYQRKLGEELVGKVYEFSFNGRELALRPEWTASVLRAYVGGMQDRPLPLRLSYTGPVFRNERPQRATYRQFTQVGVELIGGAAPRADAEIIGLACDGLAAVGIDGYTLRVGHIGLIRRVLAAMGLTERTQGILAWNLERLRDRGAAQIRELLASETAPLDFDRTLFDTLDDAQAEALLLHALREIGVNLRYGTRPPEAIVNRLVRKLRREDSQEQIDRALALLDRLCRIAGPPDVALPQAETLLGDFELRTDDLDELRTILDLIAAHGVAPERLMLDFGVGRGLNYYTGVIFEIYAPDGLQICGGGRYDDLVTMLGGSQRAPAVGFAYGLERVVASLPPALPHPERQTTLLVSAADDDSYPYAVRVAAALRALGYVAQLDVRGRGAAGNRRAAARREIDALVLVDGVHRDAGTLLWRETGAAGERAGVERTIALAELAARRKDDSAAPQT